MTISESEIIRGTLGRIIYQSGSYVVAGFQPKDGAEINVVGHILSPREGDEYELHGRWGFHVRYGHQFEVQTYARIEPTGDEAVIRYLSKTAKWVQEITANKMVELYGDETLEILRTDPERVAREISGISLPRALEIQENLVAHRKKERALLEVEQLIGGKGLKKSLPAELVELWGFQAAEFIRENPYILIDFPGVGFNRADRVALDLGIDPKSPFRQAAAAIHIMKEELSNGNTWAPRENVNYKSINIMSGRVEEGIDQLIRDGKLVENDRYIAFTNIAKDERYIANKLKLIANGKEQYVSSGFSFDAAANESC